MKIKKIQESVANEFRQTVINWYNRHGRIFFWRNLELNSWQWLLLEILLKRTNANTVNLHGKRILEKYTSPNLLQNTNKFELKEDFYPFGLYNQRIKSLTILSKILIEAYAGQVPPDYDLLLSLPYIGQYTANAILCFHYNKKSPILDINVARIFNRCFNIDIPKDLRNLELLTFTEKMLPEEKVMEYNYGLLDIGAIICKANAPLCKKCNLITLCNYQKKF